MPKMNVVDMTGKVVGEIELNDSVFGIEPNTAVMHADVKSYLANQRQGTQSTLTRAEVSGGGRKPRRQKGSGCARQGSTRAPQWTHGGIALGPKPRDFGYTINKKAKKLAIRSALSAKTAAGQLVVVDNIALDEVKTRNMKAFLKAVGAEGKALVITPEVNKNVVLSARNIPGVQTTFSGVICVYDILKADKLVVGKAAVEKLQEVYAK
ncbi:MAG: 50S ribosomal protein L4 [Clostridia bacterium]|nr:50S ribosomal protein L4 [Clostridia bacterium]MDD7672152.1 50S ribosomal protein L4 [Clostridia bacterium]MDY2930451.1 50S ribosomal protein L4 [Clostridiaceae bacterium]